MTDHQTDRPAQSQGQNGEANGDDGHGAGHDTLAKMHEEFKMTTQEALEQYNNSS